ncbi:MAG TPA: response regulator [Planctomycetota bacterium]|nr:response regulator [Planctomycetota bacterium]
MNRMIERHCVICVDDEPAILAALKRSLRQEPFDLLTTVSADDALHWVSTREISLIITDQQMPGMQGTELLEHVSRRSPSTARIILTAYPGATASTPGLRRWLECMVSKPWDSGMLRRTIRQLLWEREMDTRQEEALNEGRTGIGD